MFTQCENEVQTIEVYNLAKMELETAAKRVEKNKFVKKFNYSVSRLQLCLAQGVNSILLYCMENGLQITSKKFNEIKKIYLLEFIDSDEKLLIIGKDRKENLKLIVWDIYNTGKIEQIMLNICSVKNIDAHLARTSGNILHVDDKGNVTSVLKRIENALKELKTESEPDRDAKPIEHNNGKHKIYYDDYNEDNITSNFDKDKYIISKFDRIADKIEPWVLDDYEKNSYCLYYNKKGTETEFLQLIVGRSTVQIWHQIHDVTGKKDHLPNNGKPFLEYIWTNGILARNETELQIEDFKYGSNNENGGLVYKLNNFSLKVCWYIRKGEKKTMIIKWKDIIETFYPIIYACKALEHLNIRHKNKYRLYKYETIVTYIEYIVWKFAKYNPEQFKLLDIRHNFVKSLILGDCNHLIKFILFGNEANNNASKEGKKRERAKRQEFKIRHIPRNKLWPGKTFIKDDLDFDIKERIVPENDMELAIYYCKDREFKDTIIVAYLLEYYSEHATDCAGWMCTVSKALPLLFKYNYDDYARKLFRKKCFADQDYFLAQDFNEIIKMKYLELEFENAIKFSAFSPMVKLNSGQNNISFKYLNGTYLKNMLCRVLRFRKTTNLEKAPLALRVVPLPGFTINNILKKKVEYNFIRIILNIFLLIFIPRYRIRSYDWNELSPFFRMVLYENNDDIYDNPAIEAVIYFRWQKAKKFIFFLYFRFLIFAICFGIISWEYLNRNSYINGNFMITLIVIFYYLAFYLFVAESSQLSFLGFKKHFDEIFSIVDTTSIVLPVTIMSLMIKEFQFSDGFGNVNTVDTGLVVWISITVFFLWIKLIFHLRLIPIIGFYLYYSIIIFKTIFPFFFFMLTTIIAFAHSMFILLRDPVNISIKDQTLSGNATNILTNETLHVELKSDFNPTSRVDNPFSSFFDSVIAAYFWINGNWIQRDEFDFWVVDVITVIASTILVIFIQNMMISYMGGMHEKADTKARQALLRDRARYIANYDLLYHTYFWPDEPEPKYIYYFGHSKYFEDWFKIIRDEQDIIYKEIEEKSTFTKRIFKESSYDKVSILAYYGNNIEIDIKTNNIEKIKNMKNDVIDVTIDHLIEKFKDQKDEIENIEHIKNMIHNNIENLIKKLNENNNKEIEEN